MSNLPYINIGYSEFLSPLDPLGNSWSAYQEILAHDMITASSAVENGLGLMKITTTQTRKRNRKISNESSAVEQSAEEGTSSVAKKLDHNAKERVRRMKINASYLALRALMPDSRRSKKRWTAPAIVDRVLKHIPELQNEVEALRSNMENVKSAAKAKKMTNESPQYQTPTVSFSKVNEEEAIIQICIAREDDQNVSSFTNLLHRLEDKGICIKNASTLVICESRTCYTLHVQINHTTNGAEHLEELSKKVISWLR